MNSRMPGSYYFDGFVVKVMDEVGRLYGTPLNKRFNLYTSRLPAHRVVEVGDSIQLSFWTDDVFYHFHRKTAKGDQKDQQVACMQEHFTALIRENFSHYPRIEFDEYRLTLDKIQRISEHLRAEYNCIQDPLTGEQVFRLEKVVDLVVQ